MKPVVTAPSPSEAAKTSPWVCSAASFVSIKLLRYSPRYNNPPTRMARASTLSARMRRVRGDISPRLRTSGSVPASCSGACEPEMSVFSVMLRLLSTGKTPKGQSAL